MKSIEEACRLYDAGAVEDACRMLHDLAAADPTSTAAQTYLALALHTGGRWPAAVESANRALALARSAKALYVRGSARWMLGEIDEGIADLTESLALDAQQIDALNNLAAMRQQRREFGEAESLLRRALAIAPENAPLLRNLAGVLASSGAHDEALALFNRADELGPDDPYGVLGACMAELPAIARDDAEANRGRQRFGDKLRALLAKLGAAPESERARYGDAVGSATPFYLAYLGGIDRDLYALYGEFVTKAMAARYPAWAERPRPRVRGAGAKIRVGFVSAYFVYHSVWKLPLRGWLTSMDRQRFELFAYHTRETRDACTKEAEKMTARFHQGPKTTEEWCRLLREDELDAVIFPDTMMDSMSGRLAALRHAPIQCATWGHPTTTGLPTIDYFLSGDAMEPAGAEEHYTEKLIRLPRLGMQCLPEVGPSAHGVATFERPRGVCLVFCCQSLYKYLPEHDGVFAEVALRAPSARFVFIEGGAAVTAVFQQRLERAFEARGLSARDFVLFLKPGPPAQFSLYASAMDLAMDSLGWSGCNSSLETLAHNVPIVTMRGDTMRGRHTAAMFDMMGMGGVVASSPSEFVERCVRLVNEPEERKALREMIADRKPRLFHDVGAVRLLERFLETVCTANDTTERTGP